MAGRFPLVVTTLNRRIELISPTVEKSISEVCLLHLDFLFSDEPGPPMIKSNSFDAKKRASTSSAFEKSLEESDNLADPDLLSRKLAEELGDKDNKA